MRMSARVWPALAICALVLAGCTPVAPQRAIDRPFLVPQDLSYQYVTSCLGDDLGTNGIIKLHYGAGPSIITFENDTPETRAAAERIQACLDRYPVEDATDGFTYVDAYERAQLWDYYTAVTMPCLAARGVTVDAVSRSTFFAPDRRPWNPYTSMDGVPFDLLVELYQACPPVPTYLESRHLP